MTAFGTNRRSGHGLPRLFLEECIAELAEHHLLAGVIEVMRLAAADSERLEPTA